MARIRMPSLRTRPAMTKLDESGHFIQHSMAADLAAGGYPKGIVTRFSPEPNGCLHIGHVTSICLNFGLAEEFGGRCHLRFNDIHPNKEAPEFMETIKNDVEWLGFSWGDHLYHACAHFQKLYELALELIQQERAYVCDLTAEEVREYRGTLTEPGRPSPYRERCVEENLALFQRMREGEFEDGAKTLRAKIDMESGHINLRDPVLYRIKKVEHHRTGDAWCIYPTSEWSRPISDALEGITHSLCTLEFESQRPLYDWFLEQLDLGCHPKQLEFSPLKLTFSVLSKRKLTYLVASNIVEGPDDPRMLTIAGLRRGGFTPASLREFCERVGVSKKDGWTQYELLEDCIREDLNTTTKRVMAVLDPIKVIIENYPEGHVEQLSAPFFPDEPDKMGCREIPFSREIYIERADFMVNPPRKYFRFSPGREVRLRRAYYITCTGVRKDDKGNIQEILATYDPESLAGTADRRKVKSTLHWVSAEHAVDAEVRMYDRLFVDKKPDSNIEKDWIELLNPNSLESVQAKLEPWMTKVEPGERFLFERTGFFIVEKESTPAKLRFTRIVTLRDSKAKIMAKKGR